MTRCEECKAWVFTKDNAGYCKKRAPQPTVMEEGKTYLLVWPSTLKDDGCKDGESRS